MYELEAWRESALEAQRSMKNSVSRWDQVSGVWLEGNPHITMNPVVDVRRLYGNRTVSLFNRVRLAGPSGVPLYQLVQSGYERWLVRSMIKSDAVKVIEDRG